MKEVVGFPGYYVNELGEVYTAKKNGFRRLAEITPGVAKGEKYKQVRFWKDNKRHYLYVQRVVLETYIGPRPDGNVARHINDIGDDNRLENLEWGTPKQNAQDKKRNDSKKIRVRDFYKWAKKHRPEAVKEWLAQRVTDGTERVERVPAVRE